jgi:glycerol-3-phosphate acyltransferase PlsX
VRGALEAALSWPDIELQLVGPRDETAALLADDRLIAGGPVKGLSERITVVGATQRIAMGEDPVRAVRSRRDASVRVASRLVRDGQADATVSVGSTGAAMAAALFTLGRLPGVTRPPLAVVIPASRGPVILLDAGATVEAGPDLLLQFALAGAAYAQVHLGIAEPSVGLLSVGSEAGKGDPVRKDAARLLEELFAGLPVRFVGNVESAAVAIGGVVDVVVTDGFTGNVLLKGMEGAVAAVLRAAVDELDPPALEALGRISRRLGPDGQGGAVLLGVNGVVVVGHGASSPAAVTSCVGAAAQAVREGLLPRLTAAMGGLVERRRTGLAPESWLRA